MTGIWGTLIGKKVGQYKLEKVLKVGGEGCVFLANVIIGDQFLTQQFAVKLRDTNKDSFERHFQEVDTGTKLNHPNILRALTVGDWQLNGTVFLYLVMDLADGTLDDRLNPNSPLSKTEVLDVVKSIASALVYMHGLNPPILHRDVKPGNVMRVGECWKLGDFGIARETNSQGVRLTSLIGTQEYAPPESYKNITSLPWDMWSLGVMIVEMLTGKFPFSNDTKEGLMMDVLKADRLELAKSLPAPFDEIVRGCLIKEPQERWTAQQVLDAISQPTAPPPPLPAPPPPLPAPPEPWKILEEKYSNNEMIEVQVTGINKGGAIVEVLNLNGFIPQSHLVRPHDRSLIGQSLKVLILGLEKGNDRKLTLSEKKFAISQLKTGQLIEGTITTIEKYGVYLEFNGFRGLLHISQISDAFVPSLDQLFQKGQKIKAIIIDMKSKNKIDLSTRELEKYPGEMLKNMAEIMSQAEARIHQAR